MVPKTRAEWWLDKIKGNIANDTEAVTALQEAGWGMKDIYFINNFAQLIKRVLKATRKSN